MSIAKVISFSEKDKEKDKKLRNTQNKRQPADMSNPTDCLSLKVLAVTFPAKGINVLLLISPTRGF